MVACSTKVVVSVECCQGALHDDGRRYRNEGAGTEKK